ncbi:MAG: hypothetical protein IIW48_09095 [Clostridia bacterium]|nr:hypothetical protein [Clostridia bacterium]
MKKYTTPAVEVEKFTVADVITESNPDTNFDADIGELSNGLDANVAPSADDEF